MNFTPTHLDKIYWPKEKITKGDLYTYYQKAAPYILPYLKDRPMVMHRYPNGIEQGGFFQKDLPNAPDFVKTALISHTERNIHYILIQNEETLLYVINLGSIELHLFSARYKRLETPDFLIFDLDPVAISFDAVIETAQTLREILTSRKLSPFCKTSGGRGLHLFVPLKGRKKYEEVRAMAKEIALLAQKELPSVVSLIRDPKKRGKKVYIDILRNGRGALVAAPYSARAFPGAPVSTPLLWKEVKKGLDPKEFTIENVPARLAKKGDLFSGALG